MRSATGLLPSSLSAPRLSARFWLVLAAGLGAGVCGYAGLYPRFDDGALRIVLGLTCIPFAGGVVAAALSARSRAGAFGLALVFAAVLGMASVILPAAILTHGEHGGELVAACVFGAFFGAPTGVLYGLPLALLAMLGHRHVAAHTHDSIDRAARVAGIWVSFVALIGLAGTLSLDQAQMDYATNMLIPPGRLPALLAGAASLAGLVVGVAASLRLRRRSSWLARVSAGLEPSFRVRVADPRDELEGLPRLGEGEMVVEFVADEAALVTAGAAYRVTALGTPIAMIGNRTL